MKKKTPAQRKYERAFDAACKVSSKVAALELELRRLHFESERAWGRVARARNNVKIEAGSAK